MEKNAVKKIILESQDFIKSIKPLSRDYRLDPKGSYVFIGPRRAGKTWFMYSLIHSKISNGMDWSEILYINFEDERLYELTVDELDIIIESHKELFAKKPVCFFDEIQNIAGWQKFVRRLADQGYQLFVTGSNASMLSQEMATTLGGRFIVREIHPLSFREYLIFNDVALQPNYQFSEQRIKLRTLFDSYFYFGGFPETLHFENKKEYLSNLFQKVFYGDIVARYKIKNDFALKLMIKKLAESVHDETSFSRIRNIIQSIGVKIGTATLIEYFRYLEESFLMFGLTNAKAKISSRESKKKYYFVDNGLLNLFLLNPETILLENAVFVELRRRYGSEIYYFRENREVDFYIPRKKMLIQVCYAFGDIETRRRELDALAKAAKVIETKSRLVLTLDQEEEIDDLTRVMPVWKWALEKDD